MLNQWCQKCSLPKIIEPMTSKWCQKCCPLQIIEPLTEKTWGQGCVIFGERKNKERNGETPLRRKKYFEWIIKQVLNSAFVGYEEFADLGGCYPPRPSASVDNTLLDMENSSYPTVFFPYFKLVTLKTLVILCNTRKKEGRAFQNIGKNISLYCVISLANFRLISYWASFNNC